MSRPDSPLNAWLTAMLRDMGPVNASSRGERIAVGRRPTGSTPCAPMRWARRPATKPCTPRSDAWPRSWRPSTTPPRARRRRPPPTPGPSSATASAGAPEPLRTLWQQMGEADATLAFAALRELWGQQLAGEVTPACGRVVDGRYPFVRQGTQEVSREEFVRAFGSGGVIDGFFQRHLAGWVDTSTRPWAVRVAPQGQMGRCAAAIPARAGHPRGLLQRRRAPVRRAHGAASARTRPGHRAVDDRRRRPGAALRTRHARRATDAAMAGPGRRRAHSTAGQQRRVPAPARASRSRGRGRCCTCSSACASSRLRRRAAWCWCSTSRAGGRAWRRTTRRGRWPSRCPSWSSFNVRAACDRTRQRCCGGRLVRQDARVGRLRVAPLARRMDRSLGQLAAARTGAIARRAGRRRLVVVVPGGPGAPLLAGAGAADAAGVVGRADAQRRQRGPALSVHVGHRACRRGTTSWSMRWPTTTGSTPPTPSLARCSTRAFDVAALEQAVFEMPALHGERRVEAHAGTRLAHATRRFVCGLALRLVVRGRCRRRRLRAGARAARRGGVRRAVAQRVSG